MSDDVDLLRQFAEMGDEQAFNELVNRRLGFVYAVALRRTSDPHTARDIVQAVFVALARKAAVVAKGPSVIGWLHRSAYFESRNFTRGEIHRAEREREAQILGYVQAENEAVADWDAIRPVLDDVLHELSEPDREAVLARFFSGQSYAEVGAQFRLTENAARMRVERALVKLQQGFMRRGVASTSAALATVISAHATVAVPAGLLACVTKAGLAGVAVGAIPAAGVMGFMSTTKVLVVAAVGIVTGALVYDQYQMTRIQDSLAALSSGGEAVNRRLDKLERQTTALSERVTTSPGTRPAQSASQVIPATAAEIKPEPAPVPGITVKAPPGWAKNGSKPDAYVVGTDQLQTWGGMPSAYVKSVGDTTDGFGGMMQTISAEDFRGKRVRLSGWVKTEDANDGGGHLWLRVDGAQRGVVLQFDNMNNRAVKGTSDWQECAVVLDVPVESAALAYGFFVQGSGKMWVSGTRIEEVGPEVATTNMIKPASVSARKKPVNLGFSAEAPQ